jgi:hypothetical protein
MSYTAFKYMIRIKMHIKFCKLSEFFKTENKGKGKGIPVTGREGP